MAEHTCPSCGRVVAFDPKGIGPLPRFTDYQFKLALEAVSGGGKLRWDVSHLYYEVCRRIRRRRYLERLFRKARVDLDFDTFLRMSSRWRNTHGLPSTVISQPFAGASGALEPDVGDYSFDRVIVCDIDKTVDFLLLNNFHTEYRCPVFSVARHPENAVDRVMPMLRRSSELAVWVLHDADPQGCQLPALLAADPQWFASEVDARRARVVDIGLRPRQATRFRGMFQAASGLATGEGLLGRSEERWLGRYRLELAAIRPPVLLSWLAQLLQKGPPSGLPQSSDEGDEGWYWYHYANGQEGEDMGEGPVEDVG